MTPRESFESSSEGDDGMIEEYIERKKRTEQRKEKWKKTEIQKLENTYLRHEIYSFSQGQLEELFQESKLHLCFEGKPNKYTKHFYHYHGWFELIYVYQGNCYNHFMDTDETVILKEKEILIIQPQVPHCTAALQDTDQIFHVIIELNFMKTILLSQFYQYKKFFCELYDFLSVNRKNKTYFLFQDCTQYRIEPILELILYEIDEMYLYGIGLCSRGSDKSGSRGD